MDRLTTNIMLLYSYALFIISYRSAEYNFYYEYKKNMAMSLSVALGNFALSVVLIETIFRTSSFGENYRGNDADFAYRNFCLFPIGGNEDIGL